MPQIGDRELVARVLQRDALEHFRIHLGQVGDLRLVQRQEHARLDLPAQETQRRHHQVIAAGTGQQLGLHHLVAVKYVVGHLDAGFLLEIGNGVLCNVVGPVVDIQRLGCVFLCGISTLATASRQHAGRHCHCHQFQLHFMLHNQILLIASYPCHTVYTGQMPSHIPRVSAVSLSAFQVFWNNSSTCA